MAKRVRTESVPLELAFSAVTSTSFFSLPFPWLWFALLLLPVVTISGVANIGALVRFHRSKYESHTTRYLLWLSPQRADARNLERTMLLKNNLTSHDLFTRLDGANISPVVTETVCDHRSFSTEMTIEDATG